MPVMWKCPGQPNCRKIYLYARGLKAHIPSCKHARKKEVHQRKSDMETILTIILFVEDQQKGNVTVSRVGVPSFQIQRPVFSRYPPEGDRSRLCREPMGGYPFLEERRTNVHGYPFREERRTNVHGYPSYYSSSCSDSYGFSSSSSSSSMQYMRDIRQPLPSIGQFATR